MYPSQQFPSRALHAMFLFQCSTTTTAHLYRPIQNAKRLTRKEPNQKTQNVRLDEKAPGQNSEQDFCLMDSTSKLKI